ncbi:protein-L-isoaspartate O-methyltransferase [Roseibacterium sp. SDUM158017]|uniref:protein-L-isoaspartate O-methyltransferase family protein n=1 Tax=Roseicyclus salinarum TaxID=3036773 RepID=UPI002414D399|nr:protein-L-isoaspartate O-methyltransferase [Roseibacterium sp. SDUM158017]MDG4648526.1 protein-L-isoaspartate O-methyltransferase [Roseibacterium sp. SDUM158017]
MADFAKQRLTMVDTQVRPSDVTNFPIIDAMLAVPREEFVPNARRELAYVGGPLEIAPGRALLDPRTIAKMLDAGNLRPGDAVLEIGCGLGYTTALLAHIVDAVVAVEEDEALAAEAEATLGAQGIDNAAIVTGPLAEGHAKAGPYDAIMIFGGVEELPPALIDQVKDGGRIVAIFMNGQNGEAMEGLKSDGRMSWRMAFNATADILPGFARAESFTF